ncbi:P-loop containing nucleoside triphosphate hydrolase protein [Fimicolochytrium jonesii]|uniref:P-loop containing nucleoside triphosphate hydrolase protein n=1 Tax=Fimicolochytrium jonesii TaxID=1396493 RepID=UPI0022FDC504|nr:P-loop containing nucleoside triphosphate hydrolase protein [Fimicolochytrium jonesii]KAI8822919.1 P-loop containing nucleoside triphosphate hydrolase protein [Fimicolochytrium jonesii]
MVGRGARRELRPEEFPTIEAVDESRYLSGRILEEWDKEVKLHGHSGAKLWRVVGKVFGRQYTIAGFWYLLESCFKMGEGLTLGYLLQWFQDPNATKREGFLWALGVSICVAMHAILHHVVFLQGMRTGTQIRVAFIAAIYRKCLNLSVSNASSTGLIVNLVSNDVQRFEDAGPFAHYAWIAPVELAMALYLMYIQISWAAFPAIGSLLLVIPMQTAFAAQFAKLRKKLVVFRDDRIKTISDMLGGIMVVKLYAWEIPFIKKIDELRNTELRYIKKASVLRAINEALYFASSSLTSLFAFVTYFLMGGLLTPAKVFTCLVYLSNVRLTVTNFFPKALQFTSESRISLQRIEAFLALPDMETEEAHHKQVEFIDTLNDPTIMVAVRNGTFAWAGGVQSLENKEVVHQTLEEAAEQVRPILNNIDLTVRKGQVIGVCGPVGAGKSSLLNALLGEMYSSPETKLGLRSRRLAYCSQNPWILTGTIKENILFGRPFEETWFWEVIRACAMERDVSRFANGIDTVIGERGVTLSGGQRARLALARAVYYNADIYFLDDPLSAVDANVGRHLFEKCINGILKDKARVLVTHQLQYIQGCDHVVVMEGGRIAGEGSFAEVMNTKDSVFASALKDFAEKPADMDKSLEDEEDILAPESPSVSVDTNTTSVVPSARPKAEDGKKAKTPDATDAHTEMSKETLTVGSISGDAYYKYFSSGSSVLTTVTLIIMLIAGEAIMDVGNWWLSRWSQSNEEGKRNATNAWVFTIFVFVTVVVSMFRALLFFFVSWRAGKVLFQKMVASVFKVQMSFFQNNPHGRLMNRFSKDINLLDEMLPQTFFDFIQCAFMVVGTLVISVVVIPYLLVLVPFIALAFYFLRTAYIETSRQIKRIEAVTRSPVYSSFPSTIEGLSTVRAFSAERQFEDRFVNLQNDNTSKYFMFLSCARWLGFRLDVGSALFLAVIAFAAVGLRDSMGLRPGLIGLLLSYVLQLTGLLQWCVRQSAEVENYMVSVERVLEYTDLPPEETEEDIKRSRAVHAATNGQPPESWPSGGEVKLSGMSLTYPGTAKPVLRGITKTIPAGTKVGIVGRTGAGKSSFLQALFRIVNPTPEGCVVIDGIKTSDVCLQDLRSRISIIPQEPFCFKGNLRFNVDPFGTVPDDVIWKVLGVVELKDRVANGPGKLDAEVAENGGNWSVGERQLICLARAILRNTKLIVMDEATSAVDLRTDALLQSAIRDGMFADATVLTIAHRLNTVIDYDHIMVLDDGCLVESGTPFELLAKDASVEDAWFARMVEDMGEDARAHLRKVAEEKEMLRRDREAGVLTE